MSSLKDLIRSIILERYSENDINFVDGRAIIKQGRKVIAKIIDMNARYGGGYTQYPYNLEMNGGIRQCTDLKDCIAALNRNI